MIGMAMTLRALNETSRAEFVAVCGPVFERSSWIAERTWSRRPFESVEALHRALVQTVEQASPGEKLRLIQAHPDLVGRMSRDPGIGDLSSREQAAAGLDELSDDEAATLRSLNQEYKGRFGFPFVICARENRKEAILAAFPERLRHTSEREIATALAEIAKIALLRLRDAITEERG